MFLCHDTDECCNTGIVPDLLTSGSNCIGQFIYFCYACIVVWLNEITYNGKSHSAVCRILHFEHVAVVTADHAETKKQPMFLFFIYRFGFHWPPFCSVSHLHLHVLAPASQMGFMSRLFYRPNSYWFVTVCLFQMAIVVQ